MKVVKLWVAPILVLSLFFLPPDVRAGVPLNNLEGVGGIAFNPLAYLAGAKESPKDKKERDFLEKYGIGKPQFGAWYVHLFDAEADWATVGVADSFFNRVEVSYGYEVVSLAAGKHRYKNNVGAKLLLIPENWRGQKYIPALSVGGIWKNTLNVGPGVRENGFDGYVVASKLIIQLPRPVLLSGGGLLTQGRATGVLGYDRRSDVVAFGNVDVLPAPWLAVGYEIKQGAKFSSFKNAAYQDVHAAWLPNKNLSVVLAYAYAGDTKKPTVGLGNGLVVSLQYAF